MNKSTSTFGIAALLLSTSAFSETLTFSGATHCAEDVQLKAKAFTKLTQQQGALAAHTLVASENTGPIEQGYFAYDPQFERTSRKFNCSIPLTADIANVNVAVYGLVSGLNQSFGGCSLSRMRRISDGGQFKWFRYGANLGFDWISIADKNIQGEQFVYYTGSLNNNYEDHTTLELKCRTTWDHGSVSVGQITLTY